ncbi:MAG: hypothetical protein NTX31_14185 [Burkholderiales bacterium]|nr:hypothetical protein [Burkholderiales bacterium]
MTTKDAIKLIEQSGTKVSKDKLLDAIKRGPEKELLFAKDTSSAYAVVMVKLV